MRANMPYLGVTPATSVGFVGVPTCGVRGAGENANGIILEFPPIAVQLNRWRGLIWPVSACPAIAAVLWSGARWQVKRGVAAS
jgi:hypothetical protein